MGDHCRKRIRDAVFVYLDTGMVTVKSIIIGRAIALETDLLPALLLFTNEETIENITKEGKEQRTLKLIAECYVMQEDITVIDALDAIAIELESMIRFAMPNWIKEIKQIGTTIELWGEAIKPIGHMKIEFAIIYHMHPSAPDTPL